MKPFVECLVGQACYAYDGMNQLIDMQRGKLNTAKNGIASGKNYQDNFAFDATGNWTTYKQDSNGNGTFDLNQSRTHNKANEIATIASATTHVAHDLNGNMTKCVKPSSWSASFTLVYDAWNRLVQVKDGATTVATYAYNGLNQRVRKIVGSETRLFYFNNAWQCVEEYVGSTCDMRYVWGLRYIDDLVTYRKGSTDYYSIADANWNVAALTNTAGAVQERYTYSAFGRVNIFDATFNVRSASTCSITRTFTGQVLDNETGMMLYRNRVYHPTLGRFVQRDPIGYSAGDLSLYRYVGNRTAILNDSYGLRPPSKCVPCNCDCDTCLGVEPEPPKSPEINCYPCNCDCVNCTPTYYPHPPKPGPINGKCCTKKVPLYKHLGVSLDSCIADVQNGAFNVWHGAIAEGGALLLMACKKPVAGIALGTGFVVGALIDYEHARLFCRKEICENETIPEWEFDSDRCSWFFQCPDGYTYYENSPPERCPVDKAAEALNNFLEKSDGVTPGGPWGRGPKW